jgi:hypothetical protein
MNTNTMNPADGETYSTVQESAVQNSGSRTLQKVTFYLVWLAVSIPMIWGVLKALDEVQAGF